MKNYIKITTAAFILFSIFTFSSCVYDGIFYEIRQDVKPETPTVSGNIPNITRYKADGIEYLFLAADGGIRYKAVGNTIHGAWAIYPTPFPLVSYNFESSSFSGQQVISVFANENTLYILSAEYTATGTEGVTRPAKINLWGKTNGTLSYTEGWTLINSNPAINYFPIIKNLTNDYYDSYFNVFQTNSPMAAHRHVYICSFMPALGVFKYFELSGTNEPVEITIPAIEDYSQTMEYRAYSAAYFNGGVKFFNSKAVTTNETYTAEASRLYYGFHSQLWYSDDGTYKPATLAGEFISALATCSDSIIIGRGSPLSDNGSGGLVKTSLTPEGIPGTTLIPFTTNASFQITDTYTVLALINETPSNTELTSNLYASVTFYNSNGVYNNIGLWSYYPDRGNWNRE